jgi:transposase
VNPLQASRYREWHGVSGAKSDRGDSHLLADMVRTDSHQLREYFPAALEAFADLDAPDALELLGR